MPQLTVLMPVRDGARWLAQAVVSVLAQSFRDFELVIVDDGSVDETSAIIDGFAAGDPRIVILRQPPSGVVPALNAGLAAARAPLIARLDGDDIAEPTRFAEQIEAMQRDPTLVLLGSWATEIDGDDHVTGMRRPEIDPAKLKRRLDAGNPIIHPSVMFRTSLARKVGGYRAAFAAAEDYDLWLRLADHGAIANLPRELIRYRVHADSITAREPLQQMFATRLARRSASLRREGAPDPLAHCDTPVLMASELPAAYADIARLYRILSWNEASLTYPPLTELSRDRLSRRERTLAQQAVARMIAADPRGASVALWWRLCVLRPWRAPRALWRIWTTSGPAGSDRS